MGDEEFSTVVPSVVAAALARDPPIGLREDFGGGGGAGGGCGGHSNNNPGGGVGDVAIDSLLDDMLGAICSPQSWIPDSFSEQCMSCEKGFGFMTRRHHCRHCGRLICKQCQREMQGITAWAEPPQLTQGGGGRGGDGDMYRSSVADFQGGGRSSMAGGGGRGGFDSSLADPVKVCRQCAAAHYRSTLHRPQQPKIGY